MKSKIVLAYSGGLDTSVILKWLQTEYNADVIAYAADLGQGSELDEAKAKAKKLGAKKIYIENLKEEFKQIQEFYNIKTPLPHKNSTKHQHYSSYYTEQWMIDLVAKKFPLDIKRYNYDFEYK